MKAIAKIFALVIIFSMLLPFTGLAGVDYQSIPEIEPQPEANGLLDGIKIAVDPGHGGSATGTTGIDGPGYPDEKDHNLDIGLRLQTLLEAAGASVFMTRTTDVDVGLQERCDVANDNNTDIFISIHANSIGVETVSGTETFYWGMDGVTYSVNGKRLAQDVQRELTDEIGSIDRGAKGDLEYLGFHLYVLDNTVMPAILAEVGFMSNQTEFDLLNTAAYRQSAAQGIFEGILAYYGVLNEPVLFDVDFYETGIPAVSLVNYGVDVENTYTFYAEVNYTIGGLDQLFDGINNTAIGFMVWYDNNGVNETTLLIENDMNRTRAFNVTWYEGPGVPNAIITYPVASMGTNEFRLTGFNSWWIGGGPNLDSWGVSIDVYFGPQMRAADGGGFVNGNSIDEKDAGSSFNDANSWNFEINVYDPASPSFEDSGYEEFGVNPFGNITVSGNPAGSAPPGSVDILLSPNSNITYAANDRYYVNVSIGDLVSGPNLITANNVRVQLSSVLAAAPDSEIFASTFFVGANTPLSVWGNGVVPIVVPVNGTTSHGSWGSDFNYMGFYYRTEVIWVVNVPGATPEGIYTAPITFTIESMDGASSFYMNTWLTVNVAFPNLFGVDMWEKSDVSRTSTLNTEVPRNNTYTFYTEVNYTIGGVNQIFDFMNNTAIDLIAWYDENGPNEMIIPPEDAGHRTKMFNVTWFEGGFFLLENAIITYPVGAPNEFLLDSFYSESVGGDHLGVYLNITFSNLAQLADGSGFANGPSSDIRDPVQSYNDPNSWNFMFEVYDSIFRTALDKGYEEFGVGTVVPFDIPVQTGWNFISFPITASGLPETVFNDTAWGDGGTDWDVLQWYDPNDPNGDYWKSYNKNYAGTQELSFVDSTMGFWINITVNAGNGMLTIGGGQPPSGTTINLQPGWNMVGYPSNTPRAGNTTLPAEVTKMAVYNGAAAYNINEVPLTTIMSGGNAYWVYSTAVTTWNLT